MQINTMKGLVTSFMVAKGKTMPPKSEKEISEVEEVLHELIKSQAIFVPFEKSVIKNVLNFMEHEVNAVSSKYRMPRRLGKPLPGNKSFDTLIPAYHSNFISVLGISNNVQKLQELLSCASFMGVEPLVTLISAKIASMMQSCRKIDQIRMLLGIENDFDNETLEKLSSG